MTLSHKMQAVLQFMIPVAFAYTALGAFLLNGHLLSMDDLRNGSGSFAVVGLVGMLIQDLVPKDFKEILVFWRLADRLPGHRAFSEIAQKNMEIDEIKINNFGRFSNDSPDAQQKEFYRIYRKYKDDSSVSHKSSRYIAWRDTATFVFILMLVSFPVIAPLGHPASVFTGALLSILCGVAYLAMMIAARNMAQALVIQVLQIASTEGNGFD